MSVDRTTGPREVDQMQNSIELHSLCGCHQFEQVAQLTRSVATLSMSAMAFLPEAK